MAELSDSDIQHLARLARLELTEEEADRYATQLSTVVQYVDQLSAVDTAGVAARAGASGLKNVMAADEPLVTTDFNHDVALGAAPRRDGDFIEVRAVLGGEVGAS